MSLQAGQVLDGKYRIVRLIGEGGMGAVYEGENTRIKRRVAIKVLHSGVASNDEMVQRFEREAQVAGTVGNDHILEILDLGSLPSGERYMVMEFLDGQTLTDRIKDRGRLAPGEALAILKQALEGLSAAHAANIVHRDLKPENIFILKQKAGHKDFVKIIDFGISKFEGQGASSRMTRTGALMGTPHYMAPEQATGSSVVDARTDIYAIGIILYEAVTGRVPFEAESFNQLLFEIALAKIAPARQLIPDLDPAIDSIILKATARDPVHRFQNCAELLGAIRAWEQTGAAVQLPPEQSIEAIVASAVPRTGAHAAVPPKTTPSAGNERPSAAVPAAPFRGEDPHAEQVSGRVSATPAQSVEAPRPPTQSTWSQSQAELTVPKSSAPIIAATLFGVALLASGGAAGYWYFSHSETPAAQPPGVASAGVTPQVPPAVSAAPEPEATGSADAPKAETPPAASAESESAAAASAGVTAKPPTSKARPTPPREPKTEPKTDKPKPKNTFNFGY